MNTITQEEVDEFIKKHPIETDGALSEYHLKIQEMDDGDSYTRVELPYWFQNPSVSKGVLRFLIEAQKLGSTTVYLRDNRAIVDFYHNICDPD